jgi:MraZ protein
VFFFGTFEHSIDERGRLAIPARYRRAFVDGGVVRPGPDGCLEIYTQDTFDEEAQRRLTSEDGNRRRTARRTRRGFMHDAFSLELDRQGRVLVPQMLRDSVNIGGRVALVGCGDYIEVWDPDRWAEELRAVAEDEQDEDGDA